jgi:hypothetical protein
VALAFGWVIFPVVTFVRAAIDPGIARAEVRIFYPGLSRAAPFISWAWAVRGVVVIVITLVRAAMCSGIASTVFVSGIHVT